MNAMVDFTTGAIAMASFVAGLVFLRFFRRTRDRIFVFFVAAFWLDAAGRTLEVALRLSDENDALVYLVRLVAYGLILAAILDKNRPRRPR
ncbi:DUF5985 family protein [Tahibacter soli]|uniref:DUF5985 family protein n=1 Tax=Tahibacter soli TaxID=2983605 RepID=A0A9X3YKT9_9GAMM|nr:DUF5985 family protein [Tahibacter soli]MDC8012811.1 DUF5985 family protein [Tahibacter soli]